MEYYIIYVIRRMIHKRLYDKKRARSELVLSSLISILSNEILLAKGNLFQNMSTRP